MAYNYLFKLLLIGDQCVGKTSVASRLSQKEFNPVYDETIGVEFSTCYSHIYNNLLIKCQLWDTSGRKAFLPVIDSYYKGVAGIILVYDVSNRKSFNKVEFWLNEINKNKRQDEDVNILLLGNKTDKLNRVVSFEEGQKKAKKNNCLFFETSAKLNENIDEIKKEFCKKIFDNYDHNIGHSGVKLPIELTLVEKNNELENDCCCCS
tara:strand:+ start:3142 stop:3759 length:618 start_codon:yes stop_codon:yes gene_type:complete